MGKEEQEVWEEVMEDEQVLNATCEPFRTGKIDCTHKLLCAISNRNCK